MAKTTILDPKQARVATALAGADQAGDSFARVLAEHANLERIYQELVARLAAAKVALLEDLTETLPDLGLELAQGETVVDVTIEGGKVVSVVIA